jgi:hypothetical protein
MAYSTDEIPLASVHSLAKAFSTLLISDILFLGDVAQSKKRNAGPCEPALSQGSPSWTEIFIAVRPSRVHGLPLSPPSPSLRPPPATKPGAVRERGAPPNGAAAVAFAIRA